jgi:hypothetical protein
MRLLKFYGIRKKRDAAVQFRTRRMRFNRGKNKQRWRLRMTYRSTGAASTLGIGLIVRAGWIGPCIRATRTGHPVAQTPGYRRAAVVVRPVRTFLVEALETSTLILVLFPDRLFPFTSFARAAA